MSLPVNTGGDSSSTHQDAAAAQREINVVDVAVTTNPRPVGASGPTPQCPQLTHRTSHALRKTVNIVITTIFHTSQFCN